MTRLVSPLSCLLAGGMLVACADPNRVTFVTTTNIALDADATTQSASIGYDRYEGYVGPAYETGAVPPIVAKIKSNLSILNPEVRQFYATGNAAVLATCEGGKAREGDTSASGAGAPAAAEARGVACPELPTPSLSGGKRIMFFGTGSVIGLKVAWAGNVPDSVTLGYKRKEFSTLPIGSSPQPDAAGTIRAAATEDSYGSVLASLDMGTNILTPDNTRLALGQFFATGIAAENLANTRVIRTAVEKELAASAARSLQVVSVQERVTDEGRLSSSLADQIESTYFADPDRPGTITNMDAFKMVQECMSRVGAPSSDPNDLSLNPDFEQFQEPVARCLGLVS